MNYFVFIGKEWVNKITSSIYTIKRSQCFIKNLQILADSLNTIIYDFVAKVRLTCRLYFFE